MIFSLFFFLEWYELFTVVDLDTRFTQLFSRIFIIMLVSLSMKFVTTFSCVQMEVVALIIPLSVSEDLVF